MSELMAACVEIWESDPETLHYHGSGYIALGTAYGRPDIILVPEHALDLDHLVEKVKHLYDLQRADFVPVASPAALIIGADGVTDLELHHNVVTRSLTAQPKGRSGVSWMCPGSWPGRARAACSTRR